MRTSRPLIERVWASSSFDDPLMQVAPGDRVLLQTQSNAAVCASGSRTTPNPWQGYAPVRRFLHRSACEDGIAIPLFNRISGALTAGGPQAREEHSLLTIANSES